MGLKFGTAQVFAPHPVVPFVEGNSMVVDIPSSVDRPLEIPIAFVAVQLEL